MWWTALLVSVALGASRFERKFTAFAVMGMAGRTIERLDDLVQRHPYFEDFLRTVERAYDAAELDAIARVPCRGRLGEPVSFLAEARRRRHAMLDLLDVLSFLEVSADELSRLEARALAIMKESKPRSATLLQSLRDQLGREDESLSLDELLIRIGPSLD